MLTVTAMVPLPPIPWARPPDGLHTTRAMPNSHLTGPPRTSQRPPRWCHATRGRMAMLNAHQWTPRRPLPHGRDIQYPPYHGHDAPMPINGRHDGYGLPVPSYGCDALMLTNGCHDPPILRARRPIPTNGRHDGYSLFPSYGRDARCPLYYGCDTPMPTKTATLDA
jgi:hypothetical protein